MRGARSFVVGAAILAAAAAPALAHGGSYQPPAPALPPGMPPYGPGTSTPPPNSGGTPTLPPNSGGVPNGGRVGGTPTLPSGAGGGFGRPTASADRPAWEVWWLVHRDRYLDLRDRLRARDEPGGGAVTSSGVGRTAGADAGNQVAAPERDPRKVFEEEVLPELVKLLRDTDAEVRSAAAVAIGRLGYLRSLPALVKARKDDDRDVRDGAVLAMGMLQEPIALLDLRGVLLDPAADERTRGLAAVAMGFLGGKDASAELLSFLQAEGDAVPRGGLRAGPDSVACAILGLGLAGEASAAPVLRRALVVDLRLDVSARAFLPLALARLGDRDSIPLFLQGLEFREPELRQSCAVALGMLGRPGDDAVAGALERVAVRDPDFQTRTFAIMALGEIGGERAVADLRRLVGTCHNADRPVVALALGVARDAGAARYLREAFRDEKDPDHRSALAVALGLVRDREAAPALREVADSKAPSSLRGYCLAALGMMEDREAADVARRLLVDDNDPELRLAAALCLGLLRDRKTLPALETIARESRDAYSRGNACRLLGLVGDARSARILLAFARDAKQNGIVRTYAAAALGVLGEKNAVPLLARVGMDGNYAVFIDPVAQIASLL